MARAGFGVATALLAILAPAAWAGLGPSAKDPIDELVAGVCGRKARAAGRASLPWRGRDAPGQGDGRCDFDTVVFEAGIYDFIGLERVLATDAAKQQQLDNSDRRQPIGRPSSTVSW